MLSSLEICAGAGGQALGLEQAGFEHVALVESDPDACATLRANRPRWQVYEEDVREFDATPFCGVDLFAGGVPCPPFSVAGRQLGQDDERDLFPAALRLISDCEPRAIMLENVRGLLSTRFDEYRRSIRLQLAELGYRTGWHLVYASHFGVPQLRPRSVLIGIHEDEGGAFRWPVGDPDRRVTVGETLYELMAEANWMGAITWADAANDIAPTLVGGSKKHGGPDLGPTRAKQRWAELGVCAHGIAENPPAAEFSGMPRLTVPMAARIQGFPSWGEWRFVGRKTSAYRQVGNAFPPPVARAFGDAIRLALEGAPGTDELSTPSIQLALEALA
jgi:DNA (cytosine-5)-methyltransferase 1